MHIELTDMPVFIGQKHRKKKVPSGPDLYRVVIIGVGA